jgi:hypothetical protein
MPEAFDHVTSIACLLSMSSVACHIRQTLPGGTHTWEGQANPTWRDTYLGGTDGTYPKEITTATKGKLSGTKPDVHIQIPIGRLRRNSRDGAKRAEHLWRKYFSFPALPPLIVQGKRKRSASSFCLGYPHDQVAGDSSDHKRRCICPPYRFRRPSCRRRHNRRCPLRPAACARHTGPARQESRCASLRNPRRCVSQNRDSLPVASLS